MASSAELDEEIEKHMQGRTTGTSAPFVKPKGVLVGWSNFF